MVIGRALTRPVPTQASPREISEMNMAPKVRPLWQRMAICFGLCVLVTYKFLRLPTAILPRDIKAIVRNWDFVMFWVCISSGLTKAYIDQPCRLRMPTEFKPKCDVPEEHRLSEQHLRDFYTKGFIGPFDCFDRDDMLDFKQEMLAMEKTKSETYGFVTPRDRHFESPRFWNYLKDPRITDRCAQILGADLLCWRSQIFFKGPHAPAIQWHQATTFIVEDYQDPAIFPPDRSEMFQITVWVAVDDATLEKGCLRFACGASKTHTISFGGEEGFYEAAYSLDFSEDDQPIEYVPVNSGQFLLFAERFVHGSGPNTTDQYRLAFNMRVIPTNVPVYPNKKYYRSVYNGGKFHLDKWGVCLLRGEDRHQLSRTISPESLERGEFLEVRRPAA
jgi:non-heme Fe2+,alpha-ketoglutarate-dependent halogenase